MPLTINDLAISTGPEIWFWMFDGDLDSRDRCLTAWWESDDSMFSHRLGRVIEDAGSPVGLELGYTNAEKHDRVAATVSIASSVLKPSICDHLLSCFGWFDYLCPPIPDDAYYVQWLATSPPGQGRGLGRQLLTEVFERSRSRGLKQVHLDVTSANPAVGFYKHVGMEIVSESRVPFLERYNIPSHYRMVKHQ